MEGVPDTAVGRDATGLRDDDEIKLRGAIDKLIGHIDNASIVSDRLMDEMDELKGQIEEGKSFFEYLYLPSESLQEKLEEFKFLAGVIKANESKEQNELKLTEYIEKLKENVEKKMDQFLSLQSNFAAYHKDLASYHRTLEDKLRRLQISQPAHDGIAVDASAAGEQKSGLHYVRERHQIGIGSVGNIGLVSEVSSSGQSRARFQVREESPEDFYELPHSDLVGIYNSWSSARNDQLTEMLPGLDPILVKNGLKACEFELRLPQSAVYMGEMAYQQLVYSPFSMLFMAAAGGCIGAEYAADQSVKASLSVQYKINERSGPFMESRVSWKPDAAATLGGRVDAFAMMEMKRSNEGNTVDIDDAEKCVLMTAITAIVLHKCLKKEFAGQCTEIALPFVIGTGPVCSLYVTTMAANGIPCIHLVRYQGDQGNARKVFFGASPGDDRKKIFVALALLLSKFKLFFDSTKKAAYTSYVAKIPTNSNLKSINFSTKRNSDNTKGDEGSGSNKKSSRRSEEDAAREAAECGGMFQNLEYPFARFIHFTDSDVIMDEQKKSPFYFKCHSASSDMRLKSKEVFLKVWKVDDSDTAAVVLEVQYHRKAFEAGVPVAAPLLPEIAKSTSYDGSAAYLVFAVDYIHQDHIDGPDDFLQFCNALMNTVNKLHNQAGLLHCDLKPDNLRWSLGVVKLIDFGHAQSIGKATWYPGTKGFEAPEILKRMPNSTSTDAFSVGRIILTVWGGLETYHETPICKMLRQVAENLSNDDPQLRWSLTEASKNLESSSLLKSPQKVPPPSARKKSDSSSPPTKVAKRLTDSVTAY